MRPYILFFVLRFKNSGDGVPLPSYGQLTRSIDEDSHAALSFAPIYERRSQRALFTANETKEVQFLILVTRKKGRGGDPKSVFRVVK
jgi:hypothetical protein